MINNSAAEASANNIYGVINKMAIGSQEYASDGHVPFVYAIVFEDGDWYVGCKYSKTCLGGSHPSMLLNEEYNTSSKVVQERVTRVPHERYIIGIGDKHEVAALEQKVIRDLWSVNGRLNGRMPTGIVTAPHSQETRDKISKIVKGRKFSQEHRDKIGEAHMGMKHTQETRDKISKANRACEVRNWPPGRVNKLISLREQGLSWEAIGRELGCSWNTVRLQYLKRTK